MSAIERITIDTNILFYAVNRADGERHKKAVAILKHFLYFDCLLTLQCLSEFFYAVTKKKIVSIDAAINHIQDWQELFTNNHILEGVRFLNPFVSNDFLMMNSN